MIFAWHCNSEVQYTVLYVFIYVYSITCSIYLFAELVLSFEQCFILFCSFPLLFAFVVGGLGLEFCVFVAGWRHALRSEWPFIIIIIINIIIPGLPPLPKRCAHSPLLLFAAALTGVQRPGAPETPNPKP